MAMQKKQVSKDCLNYLSIASNKRRPLTSVAPLGIHIEISASRLISAAPLKRRLLE